MSDQAQPSQPPRPDNSSADSDSSGGGGGWVKWVLGCGCLALFAFVCAGGTAVGMSGYFMTKMAKDLEKGVEVQAEVRQKRQEMVNRENVEVRLEEPLSAADYRAYEATVDEWMDTEPFRELKSWEKMGEKENPGVFEQLTVLYKVWKSVGAIQEIGGLYVEAIENHGGLEEHYKRFLRIGAVIAAAHEVAADHRFENPGDVTSDAVAKLLYQEHAEVQKAYGSKLEKLRSGNYSFQQLAERGELGTYAVAVVPRESYKPWFDFSQEERKAFFEKFAWSFMAETMVFGDLAFPVSFGKKLPVGTGR